MDAIDRESDVVVIGGGPAGYVAAIRAAQLGEDVILIERERLGGTCLNHGCIPSKALISATDIPHRVREASKLGIDGDPDVDVSQLIRWKDRIVTRLTRGVEGLCEANGVTIIEGTGRFLDDHTIEVTDPEDTLTVGFEYAIIATGSRPIELPGLAFDEEKIMDSRQLLDIDSAPDRLVVVGAGYIGMELAGVLAKLGTEVTVIELLEDALVGYDAEMTEPIVERARDLGITFRFEEQVVGVERPNSETIQLEISGPDREDTPPVETDAVLVAVGREPVSDTISLENAGLESRDDGTIPTDDAGRTDQDHIFAVGDVSGDPMLAHVGMAEGIVASEAIANGDASFDHTAIPEVVFTDPELATVGMTPTDARDADIEPLVGTFPLRASGRAMTTGETTGFIRIVADADNHQVIGGQLVGPHASELVGEVGLAVETGATLTDIADTIHTHPTLSEGIKEATELALGRPIHVLNRD